MLQSVLARLTQKPLGDLRLNESMRTHTTFRCEAKAAALLWPDSKASLIEIVRLLHQEGALYKMNWDLIGRGSNLLVRDGGYPGLLINLERACTDLRIVEEDDESALVLVGSGLANGRLLSFLKEKKLKGFGFSFAIPGSVGGGVRMNAGTPLGWYAQVTRSVSAIDTEGNAREFSVSESDFSYRNFAKGHNLVITGALMRFIKSHTQEIVSEIEAAKAKRSNQPLDVPNVGSVFKNPPGYFAAQLIESAGFKGQRVGDAQVSPKHSNFIVNLGHAKTSDVLELIDAIQTKVFARDQVHLEPEVQIIGVNP